MKPVAPHGPFDIIDGRGITGSGVRWGEWEQEHDVTRTWKHLRVINNTEFNMMAMPWDSEVEEALPVVGDPLVFEDIVAEHCSADPPGSLDGRGEANLWIGGHARAHRVRLRDAGWMGLWTGGSSADPKAGCAGSLLTDFTIVEQKIGAYIEHVTHHTLFNRFKISAQHIGFQAEWWYEGRGSYHNSIRNFDVTVADPDGFGITLDAGNYGYLIGPGVIRGGRGIELPRNLAKDVPNRVNGVVRPDGSPCPIVYHDRKIG